MLGFLKGLLDWVKKPSHVVFATLCGTLVCASIQWAPPVGGLDFSLLREMQYFPVVLLCFIFSLVISIAVNAINWIKNSVHKRKIRLSNLPHPQLDVILEENYPIAYFEENENTQIYFHLRCSNRYSDYIYVANVSIIYPRCFQISGSHITQVPGIDYNRAGTQIPIGGSAIVKVNFLVRGLLGNDEPYINMKILLIEGTNENYKHVLDIKVPR